MKFNKNALFHQISSVPIFAMFLVMFFSWIFCGDVSSFFLVEISLFRCFFCRDVSSICLVEIVLQIFFLQGMSLQSFLGRIFRDNFWWRNCLNNFFGESFLFRFFS